MLNNKTGKKLIVLLVLVFVFLPVFAQAVSFWPLVPCGLNEPTAQEVAAGKIKLDPSYYQPCNRCELLHLGKNILDFTLVGIMPPLAAILFVWGGFLILMGGANPGLISQGKNIFWNTAIGVAIISSSWLITNTIIRSVAADNIAPEWWKFECRVTVAVSPSPTPTGTVTPTPTGTTTPTPTGALVCGASWETNLCQPRSMTCGASACSQYVGAINQYAGGAASANFLKAVMIKESACNISADSGHAYGLMQLVPSTANIYKSRCGVTANITSTWLTTPANASTSICIAAEYVRALSSTICGNTTRNIAAGYNGGSGACANSVSCTGDTSCDSSPVKKWECLYDNPQRNACNTGYAETRDYATKVLYCYNNPGF